MITREDVLHVAKLARLRLEEDEVEAMAGELSGILEHVEVIGRLDLEGVEPTAHVVPISNVWREDEPRPSMDSQAALGQAADSGEDQFRVPSPQA